MPVAHQGMPVAHSQTPRTMKRMPIAATSSPAPNREKATSSVDLNKHTIAAMNRLIPTSTHPMPPNKAPIRMPAKVANTAIIIGNQKGINTTASITARIITVESVPFA